MDRFQELGLDRSATAEEIRKAYKNLARLLHPDHQEDPELRCLAEGHMRRLNETAGMLLDPARRAQYEDEINRAGARPARIVMVGPSADALRYWRRPFNPQSLWGFVLGMVLASVFWYLLGPRHFEVISQLPPGGGANGSGSKDLTVPHERIQALERHPAGVEAQPAAARTPRAATGLTGAWLYRSSAVGAPHSSTELPREVSLQVAEDRGTIRGDYRSTSGTAANTVFHFEGKGTASYARLPWSSAAGANGEIEIRLLRPNVLQAMWWTYNSAGLGLEPFGTAVLTRLGSN